MNIQTITMDPAAAREQLREYRSALHRRADEEYQAVAAGLQALADGTPILSLPEAIQGGGFDEKMRPRLAIARADRTQLKFSWSPVSTSGVFDTRADRRGRTSETLVRSVDLGRRHGRTTGGEYRWDIHVEGYALVPMIPASVRNSVRFSARDCFILFEVEEWADTPLRARPDRDPYLLRHLGGDAYAVLAEWDLTPLEQLVMAGRRGN